MVDRQDGSRAAIEPADRIVSLGTEFNPGYILDTNLGSVRVRAHDHVAEFLRGRKAPLGAYLVGEHRARHRRRPADLASGRDDVLFLDGAGDVGNGQAQLGQLVRLDPHAHGILAAAQHAGLPHTLDPGY